MITRYIKQPEFGDTWLQEKINKESLETIANYYEKFAAVTGTNSFWMLIVIDCFLSPNSTILRLLFGRFSPLAISNRKFSFLFAMLRFPFTRSFRVGGGSSVLEQLVVLVLVANAAAAAPQRVVGSQQERRHPQRRLANRQRNERRQIHGLQKRKGQHRHGRYATAGRKGVEYGPWVSLS